MKGAPSWMCVGVRVTIECPECASPIPVNGVVPTALCHACQAVVALDGPLGWDSLTTYAQGEGCLEMRVAMSKIAINALDYFFALDDGRRRLQRRRHGCSLELDEAAPRCAECHAEIEGAMLVESLAGADAPHAFCPSCGKALPFRLAGDVELSIHPAIAAVVSETAPRGDLEERSDEAVLFSCMGCGGPWKVDGDARRITVCSFCGAANYLPDALWLRLHPAQRKRPFYFLLRADMITIDEAKNRAKGGAFVTL